MKNKTAKWEVIGRISVDAGCIKIGDPCYEGELDWSKFALESDAEQVPHSGRLEDAGKDRDFGQAVILQSGLGDGIYAVEVKRCKIMNAIKEVRIKFF